MVEGLEREINLPLFLSDQSLLVCSKVERGLVWFPIVGWLIGGFLQYERIWRAIDDVKAQLQKRSGFSKHAWEQAGMNAVRAEEVARVIGDEFAWPNCYFLPGDPLALLFLDQDGMGWFDASHVMKKIWGVEMNPEEIAAAGYFGELVARLSLPG